MFALMHHERGSPARRGPLRILSSCALAFAASTAAAEWDISGDIGAELRTFFQSPRLPQQARATGSISVKPEFYRSWGDGTHSFLFEPFARLDQKDERRTHFDVREFSYIYAARSWEARVGIRKLFWGVAESNHLIDVINQVDLVENLDLEDRLGQPMLNLALIRDWGTLDFFVLPGFRERTFPGREGRLQFPLRVDTSAAEYESSAEQTHVDYAVRYAHYFGPFDVGLYHFWGTSRDPRFQVERTRSGELVLAPVYDIIHQTATDVQATLGNWLLKFEGLRRQGQGETYIAAIGGFEYTFVGVLGTNADLGVLAEYHFDERGKRAFVPFNDDLFVGGRLAVNDVADTQVLGGMFTDMNGGGHFVNLEASRRFGQYWKVEMELRLLLDVDNADPLWSFNRDDYLQVDIIRFF